MTDVFAVSKGKDVVMDFSALDHDKIQVDKVYEDLDLKCSRNGKNVILTTDIGALKIKKYCNRCY